MKPTWKPVYAAIEAAVINLDSVDLLLQRVVEAITATYQTPCLLWSADSSVSSERIRVYGTPAAIMKLVPDWAANPSLLSDFSSGKQVDDPTIAQRFEVTALPPELTVQSDNRQVAVGEGNLIRPVKVNNQLQCILHLGQSPKGPWTEAELESLEVVCSQLVLALNTLDWQTRLEHSRQQAALVGRIARLVNSNLNPDEIVGRIVAELGMGLGCDRCLLMDLRSDPVKALAIWTHPDRSLPPIQPSQTPQADWQNVSDAFLQSGASYLEMEADETDPLASWWQNLGAVSALMVPLFVQEEFFGVTVLVFTTDNHAYRLDDLQTVRQVADEAAIALTNAQNYQSLWWKKEAQRLQHHALQLETIQDGLTQLLNRRSLERELTQFSTPARWTVQAPFSVVLCDIDYFKLVNDQYGHLVGDEVLRQLALRLQKQLRQGTPVYRYGGEEFVVLLPEVPLSQAVEVAERLRTAIRSVPFSTSVGLLEITISLGVARQHPEQDTDAWSVLQRAEQSLSLAKQQGRDRVMAL